MSKHAIIIIRSRKGHYLQYYDKDWDCYLFPNCKIKDKTDIESIKEYLSNQLYVNYNEIDYVGYLHHNKFSQKDKIEKEYEHYFYKVDWNVIKDNDYKWFLYTDLLSNKKIQEVNNDIIQYVKRLEDNNEGE